MKKRLFAGILCFNMLFSNVNAQELIEVSYPKDDSVLVVSGNVADEEMIGIKVLTLPFNEDTEDFIKEGNLKFEITKTDIEDNPGFLDWVWAGKSDADGNYEFLYKTEGESGYYIFSLSTGSGKEKTIVFEYYGPEFTNEKIKLLNEYINDKNAEQIIDFLKKYSEPLSVGNDYYTAIANESYAIQIGEFFSEFEAVSDKADLREKLRAATIVTFLNNVNGDSYSEIEKIFEHFEELGLKENNLYSLTLKKTLLPEAKNRIIADLKTVKGKNDTEIKTAIEHIILLGAVNYSAWGKIMTVFNENAEYFGDEIKNNYIALSDAQKADVAKTIAKKASEVQYTKVDALMQDIAYAISISESQTNSYPSVSGGSSGGTSGGSSGGSSGSYSGGYYPTTNISASPKKTFSDLDSVEWAREAIEELAEKGIVSGRSEAEFAPNEYVKREEFLAMLIRAFDLEDEGAVCEFEDVDKSSWYYKSVASAYSSGITSGMSDNVFGTGLNITREDMCTLAYKAAMIAGKTMPDGALEFADNENISGYAKRSVAAMSQSGVVKGVGDNKFEPKGIATRASAAKIIHGLLNI